MIILQEANIADSVAGGSLWHLVAVKEHLAGGCSHDHLVAPKDHLTSRVAPRTLWQEVVSNRSPF